MSDPAENDYARMLELAVSLLETRDPDHLWRAVAEELMRALGGEVVFAKDSEWAADDGPVRAWRRGVGAAADVPSRRAVRLIREGYPFAGHYGTGQDRAPRTAAQLTGARWRNSETASVLRQCLGTDHMLGLPLPGRSRPVRGFLIHRAGRDFDERALQYAAAVQPLLRAAAAQHELLTDYAAAGAEGGDRGAACPPAVRTSDLGLTPRETAVLRLLAEGLPAQTIGRRLHVSVRTVHKHLQSVYRKLDAPDRLSAVLNAQRLGLLDREAPRDVPAPAGTSEGAASNG
ncbi:helix-turn-helix transcriptional regulator [Streptomyces pristinaespiralis]|uniref:helix-turn-helix transcriptional regulator n=1 Tax=Streptomyces pristinaespiralis TaxID=38300 RepID=UPI003832415D